MIHNIVEEQRLYFLSEATKAYDTRMKALHKFKTCILGHEQDILNALNQDLNKPPEEGYMTELVMVLDELNFIMKHLSRWVKPVSVRASLAQMPAKCRIRMEPYGVVLIMAPWNYPFQLTMEPLIGAIAAGNCAVVKPSAYSPATSHIIRKIVEESFPASYVSVIEGGREQNSALLSEKFDYIFFTGSVAVGKLVMESASRHLTPVSLELGGKSPCIVDESADLALAAKRLVFGKYLNAGQTCVAPDYLYVHEAVKSRFIEELKSALGKAFPGYDYSTFTSIINDKHFTRIAALISGEQVLFGGHCDPVRRFIEPTILDHISWESPVMQEEIFGPVLPVLSYNNLDAVIQAIQFHPRPLATYLFTRDKAVEKQVLSRVSFGGGCINDTIMHLTTSHMGFGGVGESGMGNYHGKRSFDTFTHEKSIQIKGRFDMPFRFRPYTAKKSKILHHIFSK
ncbi:MAG: aldehyde dehydrogenase [Clostridia bacterium]|nr:aldehyde dehydrogenase [Clostridia bacterium]